MSVLHNLKANLLVELQFTAVPSELKTDLVGLQKLYFKIPQML